MKVAIISYSGNTGKTTLAKNLLVPLIPGAQRIQIEDVNSGDGKPDMEIGAQKFKSLAAMLNVSDDEDSFVIDIGSTNAKLIIEKFFELTFTRDLIDFWVVPVVPEAKQKTDTVNTVASLIKIGIDPSKIIVVPNKVVKVESFDEDFRDLRSMAAKGVHVLSTPVLSSDVFDELKNKDESVFDVMAATVDFAAKKKALKEAGDFEALAELGNWMVMKNSCETVAMNLRMVFEATPMADKVVSAA